jgi:hypothetical protein
MRARKSWREKLADSKNLPQVMPITGKMSARWGKGTVGIPAPIEVDAIMKRVPRGKRWFVADYEKRLVKLLVSG